MENKVINDIRELMHDRNIGTKEAILEHLLDVQRRKDHDYNGAFDKACNRLGDVYAVGKIYEKTERIITLSGATNEVEDEGLADAVLDNMGYCLLYLARLVEDTI